MKTTLFTILACTLGVTAEAVDLQRYPTTMLPGDTSGAYARTGMFNPQHVYKLSGFEY
mgnify:FL=1